MFGLFNKKDNILPYIDDEGNMYDADDVTVHYEGTLISPEDFFVKLNVKSQEISYNE
jgi:hypothetical protein